MRISASANDLPSFRDETRTASGFELKLASFADQSDWAVSDGALSHRTRGFFHVVGALNEKTREERLILHQPQSAVTGLAVRLHEGRVFVLAQARPEPGNCEEVQYGPTIQSTPANYMRLHGGNAPAHLDSFIDCVPHKARPLAQTSQLDLSNRYFQKIKTLVVVEALDWFETGHDLIWVPLDHLAKFLHRDHFFNIDFRSLLACFDWDRWASGVSTLDGNPGLLQEERPAPSIDPEFDAPAVRRQTWRLVGLDELSRFLPTPHGIESRTGEDPSVRLYHSVCRGREKADWVQPLFEVQGIGEVTLFVRREPHGAWRFLLSRVDDACLAGGSAWTTSIDRAPEEPQPRRDEAVLSRARITGRGMMLSEEGGRFLRNSNRYEIVEVDEGFPLESNQAGVDGDSFRALLQASNRATIHLRCAASLVLDVLYPATFGPLREEPRSVRTTDGIQPLEKA